MIKSVITDITTNKSVHLNCDQGKNGLIVDTRPLKTFDNTLQFFTNNLFGKNLAQNALPSGDNIKVWNGVDTLWTPSTLIGNVTDFDFDSTDQAQTGTISIDCTNSEGGDTFQLETTDIISNFGSLTGYVYVTEGWNDPNDGVNIVLWNTNTGLQASENSVDLDDYIDGTNTGIWQKFTIPYNEFGIIDDFNAIRFTILQGNTPPHFYIDNITLESFANGGPYVYEISPSKETWLYVNTITFTYVGEYDSTILNSTLPNIPYNSFFNVPKLDTGLVYQRIQNGEIILTSVIKRHIDIMTFGRSQIMGSGFDGTYSWVSIEVKTSAPIILKDENSDKMQFIISDDLSLLEEFNINISGKVEDRS